VSEARFQTYGCGPTIAAASAVSEKVVGRAVEELLNLKPQEVEDAVEGLPDDRKHAADVVAGALRAAALDALRRRGGGG
jgi:NifU-like protein involved in Fe-S cluster formation